MPPFSWASWTKSVHDAQVLFPSGQSTVGTDVSQQMSLAQSAETPQPLAVGGAAAQSFGAAA